jgi:PAS domain-containing protein
MLKTARDRLLHRAVDGLYEAATDPTAWTDTLDMFDQVFGAESAHLFSWDEADSIRVASNRSSSFADNHPEWDHFQRMNPRREILRSLPLATPMNCADYIDDRAVSRSEYFTDYSLPAGRRYLLGTYAYKENNITTAFAVMRGPGRRPFDAAETSLLAHVMPHLRRAAHIDRRMRAAHQASSLIGAALDRLTDAVLVVDAGTRIIRVNVAAEDMFASSSALGSKSGRLHATDESNTTKLRKLIDDAARIRRQDDGNTGGAMVLNTPDGLRWVVVVAPLLPRAALFDLTDRRLALVVASRIPTSASVQGHLRTAFQLTSAEARLAERIVRGTTLGEAASEFDVQLATLRTQLKSIFLKTDTQRQGELMQLGALFLKSRETQDTES